VEYGSKLQHHNYKHHVVLTIMNCMKNYKIGHIKETSSAYWLH